jgi:hypothetical protein
MRVTSVWRCWRAARKGSLRARGLDEGLPLAREDHVAPAHGDPSQQGRGVQP